MLSVSCHSGDLRINKTEYVEVPFGAAAECHARAQQSGLDVGGRVRPTTVLTP